MAYVCAGDVREPVGGAAAGGVLPGQAVRLRGGRRARAGLAGPRAAPRTATAAGPCQEGRARPRTRLHAAHRRAGGAEGTLYLFLHIA